MAGELASAIAKTGQPRNRPQSVGVSEEALDNAFNGRRRADEAKAAKEAADREKRLDKINENTIFDTKFDNPYYQRQWQEDVNKAQDDILQATLTGDANSAAIAGQAIRKLRALEGHYDGLNKNMNEAKKLYYEKPSQYQGFSDPQTINGVTYDTMWDALNDPMTKGREAEVQKAFNSPFSNIAEEDVTGEKKYSVRFNPGAAFARSPEEAMKERISNPDIYTRRGEDVEKSYLGTRKRMTPMQMDEKAADEITVDAYMLPDVSGYAYQQDYRNRKAKANGNWTWAEQIATVNPQKVAEYASMNTAYELKQRANKYEEITAPAPKAPREAKPSAVEKNYGSWGEPTFNKNTRERSVSLGQAGTQPRETDIIIPLGSKTHNEKGMMIDSPIAGGTGSKSAIAKGPAVLKDAELYMKYLADNGEGGYEDVFIPATNENFKEFAQNTRAIESQEAMDELLRVTGELVGTSGKEVLDGFVQYLSKGGVTAKFPSGKPAAKPAANSNTINLQELPVGAKIETKNGKNYYNGKEIIM